jgi:hypothetical protein
MSSITSRLDQRRAAKNQSLFRNINERVNDINKAHDLWVTLSDWLCECPAQKCTTRIALTPQQYEAIRVNPTHFIVAPSREHLVPDVERVIKRRERYWVVEKLGGATAVAEQLDPREPTANGPPAP